MEPFYEAQEGNSHFVQFRRRILVISSTPESNLDQYLCSESCGHTVPVSGEITSDSTECCPVT